MARRRLIWNLIAVVLFVVLAIVLPAPAWVRIVLVAAAVLELGLATLVRSALTRQQSVK